MRLSRAIELPGPGWHRIIEDAPVAGPDHQGALAGVMDSCLDLVTTETGRLDVRGGAKDIVTLDDGAGGAMSAVLAIGRFSQSGAALVAHRADASTHYAFLYDGTLQTLSQRVSLSAVGWNTAAAGRPRLAELFERLYIVDATAGAIGSRRPLLELQVSGAVAQVQGDLGAGLETLRPFCHGTFNNVLFIAGHDQGGVASPAMVRHSFLGQAPTGVNGWDKDAWALIGSKGEPVTALVPGHYLLVAKQGALYRVSGFGRALPGWQYAIEPIDQTNGIGVEWPGALCYAEGRWYGVGYAGAFVTDGQEVAVLTGPRRRTFAQVGALDRAVVTYYPARRVVAFLLAVEGATVPNRLLLWSVDREAWVGDWRLPVPAADVFAIPDSAAQGPASAPSAPSFTHSAATETTIAFGFTAGDASAHTRVWVDRGAGYVLDQTLAPGVVSGTISNLTVAAKWPVQLQHLKNGLTSPMSPAGTGYTLLEVPQFSAAGTTDTTKKVVLQSYNAVAGQRLEITEGARSIVVYDPKRTETDEAYDPDAACDVLTTYTATNSRVDWPFEIDTRSTTDTATPCTNEPI